MDEAAAAATLTPLIKISYGIHINELTSAEVIHKINECVPRNKQIELHLYCPGREDFDEDDVENYQLFRFDATADMQNRIVETSRHIKKIRIWNNCSDKAEHRRCFTFFTRIVRGIIGNGKYLEYYSPAFEFEIEQANQLADSLRQLNNNNNDAIEVFDFDERSLTPETFQPLWDALLDSDVREIRFLNYNVDPSWSPKPPTNDSIIFTGMETNKSLIKLDLTQNGMGEEDFQNLFNSIKKNKGVEKLTLHYWKYRDLSEETKKLFEEMMCENITLSHCCLYRHGDVQDRIFEVIQFQMKVNRMWKRYIMKREEEKKEKKTPTVIPRIEEGDNNNNNEDKEEEERKKRLKMKLLFHVFHQKTVLRDTILFHLLSEYPDDLIDTDHFRDRNSE